MERQTTIREMESWGKTLSENTLTSLHVFSTSHPHFDFWHLLLLPVLEGKALHYYDSAIRLLLRQLQGSYRDTFICATTAVILNVYEIMCGKPLQITSHIAGARALIKECGWNATSVGVGAACFWLNVGMELLSCLHFNWQVAWNPSDWGFDNGTVSARSVSLLPYNLAAFESRWTHEPGPNGLNQVGTDAIIAMIEVRMWLKDGDFIRPHCWQLSQSVTWHYPFLGLHLLRHDTTLKNIILYRRQYFSQILGLWLWIELSAGEEQGVRNLEREIKEGLIELNHEPWWTTLIARFTSRDVQGSEIPREDHEQCRRRRGPVRGQEKDRAYPQNYVALLKIPQFDRALRLYQRL